MEYHVYQTGTLQEGCFRTIWEAVPHLKAGDILTVHEGIYREEVNPTCGGLSDDNRITYRGAKGEKVILAGSEQVTDWQPVEGNVFKLTLENTFFGEFNPYKEVVFGDWYVDLGRTNHLGEVYCDGKAMMEAMSLEEVMTPAVYQPAQDQAATLATWYCEVDDTHTTIWANFTGKNPAEHLVEINVRPHCFWPSETGINYITVENFTMRQAATQWAPPTAYQEGAVGPHWSKGWVIQDNIIHDSKCTGISLGKCRAFGDNDWTRLHTKHGTQRQRDVVFQAVHGGWHKDTIGSHLVRNNTIYDCEQAGICGHLGCAFSTIEGNVIYNIHCRHHFEGFEIGGIKLHAALDVTIKNNKLDNCFRGLWLDWQAQGTRVSQNLFVRNDQEDFFIEVSHGPYVVDSNIFLSDCNLRDFAQGGAYVHNLFAGNFEVQPVLNRFTHYHFPHDTAVAGMMVVLGGDDRFINNIFLKQQQETGLFWYDHLPTVSEFDANLSSFKTVVDYADMKLPMTCQNNLYLNGAKPYRSELNSVVAVDQTAVFCQDAQDNIVTDLLDYAKKVPFTKVVDSVSLGTAYESETVFETAEGETFVVSEDYFGQPINPENPLVGPFSMDSIGSISIALDKWKAQ